MVTNNQIIESEGKRFRVQLIEIVTPTFEMAREVGFKISNKDMKSQILYAKLKTLEKFYNAGKEGKFGVYLTSSRDFFPISFRQIFNFKDRQTAQKFIEEQQELLKIFYQL